MDNELDVVTKVQDEIKSLGDNVKGQYEELRKSHEELKSSLESLEKDKDVLTKNKIEKLAADISTRQEALEKAHTSRLDSIEMSLKQFPKAIEHQISAEGDREKKEALSFFTNCAAVRNVKTGKGSGLKESDVDKIKESLDVKLYQEYKKALISYLRGPGDERDISPDSRKTLLVGVDPDGGYLVTPTMAGTIFQRLYELDPIRELANVETISTDAFEMIEDIGDAGADWESETVTSTDSTTPQWGKKRIGTYALATRPRMSQMLIEDASINMETWLANKIGNRFARTEGSAFILANGVGRPRGFLTIAARTTENAPWVGIQQVNMGAAASLTADGFVSIKYALKEFYLNQGTWIMSRSTMAAAMILKNAIGDYIWKPSMIASDPASYILGLPVRLSPNMPAVAANALPVALAYWKEAYYIIDRIGISIQRDPYTVKPLVEFYTRKRVGGDVLNYDAIKLGVVHV